MSFRALKTFVELKIFYFVDPIDSIQYIGNQLFSTRVVQLRTYQVRKRQPMRPVVKTR